MVIPIFKKSKFDETQGNKTMKDIAENVSIDDRNDIDIILKKFGRDARGNLLWSRQNARLILPYFQKYIDPNIKDNIFGCGGCATKVINKMFRLQREWQNPTT